MPTMTSKWGVELVGEVKDTENICKKLNGSIKSKHDLFVSRANSLLILRTNLWDTAGEGQEIIQLAQSDINLLRGCLNVLENCQPIEVGTVFEFGLDGEIVKQQRTTNLNIYVYPADKDILQPLKFRKYLNSVIANEQLRISVSDFGSGSDWFALYKCLEALKRFYGDEDTMFSAYPDLKQMLKKSKRTANTFRHTSERFRRDPDPATLEEATEAIKAFIRRTMDDNEVRSSGIRRKFKIQNYSTPNGEGLGLNKLEGGPPEG